MFIPSPWFRPPAALLCVLPSLAQAQSSDLAERVYPEGLDHDDTEREERHHEEQR